MAYWDMTDVFNAYVEIGITPKIHRPGILEKSGSIIRSVSFSDTHKVLTIVLREEIYPTTFNIEIRKSVSSDTVDTEVIHNFLIHVDTRKNATTFKNVTIKPELNEVDPKGVTMGLQAQPTINSNPKAMDTYETKKDLDEVALQGNTRNKTKQFYIDEGSKINATKLRGGISAENVERKAPSDVKIVNRKKEVPIDGFVTKSKNVSDDSNNVIINPDNAMAVNKNVSSRDAYNLLPKNDINDSIVSKNLKANGTNPINSILDTKNNADKDDNLLNNTAIASNEDGSRGESMIIHNSSFIHHANEGDRQERKPNLQEMQRLQVNDESSNVHQKSLNDSSESKNALTISNKIKQPIEGVHEIQVPENNPNLVNLQDPNQDLNHSIIDGAVQIPALQGPNRKLLSLINKDAVSALNEYADENVADIEILTDKDMDNDPESWKNPALDIYGNSLLYTNRQFNMAYGHNARKVIAHMPHLIDLDTISSMFEKFSKQWSATSAHKLRSPDDMQFEFSYFHFLSSEKLDLDVENIFDEFDTDQSRSWSDREIRTLLTRVYSLPLMGETVSVFEDMITECASDMAIKSNLPQPVASDYPHFERYYDSKLPAIVTKDLIKGIDNTSLYTYAISV